MAYLWRGFEIRQELHQLPSNSPPSIRATDGVPPEVYDAIIDHLHDDLDALLDCSLVCHAWLPTTRLHLFQEIRFNELAEPAAFAALLCAPGSTISPSHITQITLNIWECREQILGRKELLWASRIESLRLHDLRFSSESWENWEDLDYDSSSQIEAIKVIFPNVKHLSLFDGHFETPSQLLQLIGDFPRAQSLTLRDIHFEAIEWPGSEAPYLLPSRLQTLDVSSDLHLLYDLEHITRDSSLQSIKLGWVIGEITCNRVANVVRSLGPNLKHISLKDFNYPNQINLLSENINLCSIHITDLYLDEMIEYRWVDPLKWATTLLGQVRSTRMEEVVFEIIPARFEEMKGLNWDSLENILEQKPYSMLHRIQFNITGWKHEIHRLVTERLPQCALRGIIKVVQIPPKRRH